MWYPLMALLLLLPPAAAFGEQRPRIAVAGISHESNSFNPAKTTLDDFRDRGGRSSEERLLEWEQGSGTVSGYVEAAKRLNVELYPTLVTGAQPKGPVTDEAFNTLMDELIRQLRSAPKFEGLLLANHGAMIVESHPHGDAEMVRRLRDVLGPDLPIVVNHDYHANVSEEIVRDSTVLITYQENPHLDTKQRGALAAEIMAAVVAGTYQPVQALARPGMLYNIVHQKTADPPWRPILDESRRLEQDPRILAVSVAGGYQYADVPAMGPSVIVVTDNDRDLARREAGRLSDMLWDTRDRLALDLPDPAAAVRQAMDGDRFPVVLLDMGDNIGGGSAGDSTFLLKELVDQKAEGWVMVIADREASETAFRIGVGGSFDMLVGGKTDRMHGDPVRVRGSVKSLHDARYIEPEVRHGGGRYHDMGLTAVIEVEGSTRDLMNLLVLTPIRTSPNSLHQLINLGIYPERQKILVVKGAIAPRTAYLPIAGRMIEVDSPGATAVNPTRFIYRHVPRPLFGLDEGVHKGSGTPVR
jgi:microcystin degradation protein MlrC